MGALHSITTVETEAIAPLTQLLSNDFPVELWQELFTFLSLPSLASMLLANKKLSGIAEKEVQRRFSEGLLEEEYTLLKTTCRELNVRNGKITQQQFLKLTEAFFEATACEHFGPEARASCFVRLNLDSARQANLFEVKQALVFYLHDHEEGLPVSSLDFTSVTMKNLHMMEFYTEEDEVSTMSQVQRYGWGLVVFGLVILGCLLVVSAGYILLKILLD